MNVNKRNAVLQFQPIAPAVVGISTPIEINIEAFAKLYTINGSYLTPRLINETSNELLVTPATLSLIDVDVPNRFVLLSTNTYTHNNMSIMTFYDTKYNDMFVIPSLELYNTIPYIDAVMLRIGANGINFSGIAGDKMPVAPNTGYDIKASIAALYTRVGKKDNGGYLETILDPTYRLAEPGLHPSALLNFGLPSAMFTTLGFSAQMNVFGYSSILERDVIKAGIQPLEDVGYLVADINF